jgi:hypothetical protein
MTDLCLPVFAEINIAWSYTIIAPLLSSLFSVAMFEQKKEQEVENKA